MPHDPTIEPCPYCYEHAADDGVLCGPAADAERAERARDAAHCRGMADAAEGVGDTLAAAEYRRIARNLEA